MHAMKTSLKATAGIALLAALMTGCAGTQEPAEGPGAGRSVSVVITCPVSGTELGAPARAWQSEYRGQTYYFCCSDCKKDFDKDPQRYLKK